LITDFGAHLARSILDLRIPSGPLQVANNFDPFITVFVQFLIFIFGLHCKIDLLFAIVPF